MCRLDAGVDRRCLTHSGEAGEFLRIYFFELDRCCVRCGIERREHLGFLVREAFETIIDVVGQIEDLFVHACEDEQRGLERFVGLEHLTDDIEPTQHSSKSRQHESKLGVLGA